VVSSVTRLDEGLQVRRRTANDNESYNEGERARDWAEYFFSFNILFHYQFADIFCHEQCVVPWPEASYIVTPTETLNRDEPVRELIVSFQ
jgi:hypothetical protein